MTDDATTSDLDGPAPSDHSAGTRVLFQIKDHAEMIIVAFIMALVIRCFFVEVFKIPTGSMEPTLMGNNERTGEGGDRIMVNKFHYQFHSVKRFDVIVFRYPLNVMRNFIKRAVGVGPEYLRMQRGDIYHAKKEAGPFRIARKEFDKQQSLWIPLPATESVPSGGGILDYWRFAGPADPGSDPGVIELTAGDSGASDQLIFNRPLRDMAVTADRPQETGNNRVKDLNVRASISRLDTSDTVSFRLVDGSFRFTLELSGSDPSRLLIRNQNGKNRTKTLNLASQLGTGPNNVSFFIYDGQVGLALNGSLIRKFIYRSRYDQLNVGTSSVSKPPRVTCSSGSVKLKRLGVFRDIYYYWDEGVNGNFNKADEPIRIPEDRFLVIGDNVNSSRDSRKWKMIVAELENGTSYKIDQRNWNRALNTGKQQVVDRSGRRLSISKLQTRARTRVEPMRFIRRELLVGKAIWVWWPYDRLKFIR